MTACIGTSSTSAADASFASRKIQGDVYSVSFDYRSNFELHRRISALSASLATEGTL